MISSPGFNWRIRALKSKADVQEVVKRQELTEKFFSIYSMHLFEDLFSPPRDSL